MSDPNWTNASPLERLGLWLTTNAGLPDDPTSAQVDDLIDVLDGRVDWDSVRELLGEAQPDAYETYRTDLKDSHYPG